MRAPVFWLWVPALSLTLSSQVFCNPRYDFTHPRSRSLDSKSVRENPARLRTAPSLAPSSPGWTEQPVGPSELGCSAEALTDQKWPRFGSSERKWGAWSFPAASRKPSPAAAWVWSWHRKTPSFHDELCPHVSSSDIDCGLFHLPALWNPVPVFPLSNTQASSPHVWGTHVHVRYTLSCYMVFGCFQTYGDNVLWETHGSK